MASKSKTKAGGKLRQVKTWLSGSSYQYSALPEESGAREVLAQRHTDVNDQTKIRVKYAMVAFVFFCVVVMVGQYMRSVDGGSCDSTSKGYQCSPEISRYWGQYSSFFQVHSDIPAEIPDECTVTFAQVLSRHGARDPTASKSLAYRAVIEKIQANVEKFHGHYAFLQKLNYSLGSDQLTPFGQNQMVHSGMKFYKRYAALASESSPFVRSSGQDRVVESALNWTQGFHQSRSQDKSSTAPDTYPYDMVVIPETSGSNNSLSHDLCTAFEVGDFSHIGSDCQQGWGETFTASITARLNSDLPGANLNAIETIYLMDLCPFYTVAHPGGSVSPFCKLFTVNDWKNYDYYQSLGKWYGYGLGNALGPTQGIGFTNELIARLTGQPVLDRTSTNHTLDSDPLTFPLDRTLYADFSHDNDLTSIFAVLGLYSATPQLSLTERHGINETQGYSASWTVPFAARMYVEKMTCGESSEEFVRVLVNDRVVPLRNCGVDRQGRCKLGSFIESLDFAQSGGHWDDCFT